ncbi:MAG: Txe/YoeB family addiction module toxin [Selenomonadaceae bacterium]|nr:Txe/YoeB family addiction module toxin [Selenomonadaceae bacterium]
MNKHFTNESFEQYLYWEEHDEAILQTINRLLQSIEQDGVDKGLGKPELLKHELAGHWSRRIDETNRLVQRIDEQGALRIEYCRGHYE